MFCFVPGLLFWINYAWKKKEEEKKIGFNSTNRDSIFYILYVNISYVCLYLHKCNLCIQEVPNIVNSKVYGLWQS